MLLVKFKNLKEQKTIIHKRLFFCSNYDIYYYNTCV